MLVKLDTLVARYDELNRLKTQRALDLMSRYGQQVFQLLPVMLHFNHPLLPGYVAGDVPHGIWSFVANEAQQAFIQDLCQNANCQGGLSTHDKSIQGLYSMGSTSSIGQCCHSDLDIWVCHVAGLSSERLALLEQKCQHLSLWAEQRGVDLNFFLIPEDKFRQRNDAQMQGESCGSAQHLLLLDEFYRSAMHIAGKRLLWYLVPAEYDDHYDDYVNGLFAHGKLSQDDWLDLGGFDRIPAEEYFGSALWQLYKGIDSPYKAVLKSVLMEAYSHEYPNTRLLSVTSRDWFQHNEGMHYRLDNYCLMLDKVTNYLKSIGDMQRLDLVRRCFYLKVCDGLSHPKEDHSPDWRREQMAQLVAYWGWSPERLHHLDHRQEWKVEDVKVAYAELLEALMQSYRNLIQFARRNNISESINPEDIGILSRKLYAAFESLPGKVQRINLKIAPDLGEPDLSLVQVPHGRLNRAGWYLYKHSLEPADIIGRAPLEYNGYISKLVAWAYFNGLLTPQSRVHLFNQGSDLHIDNLHQFCRDLSGTFPVKYLFDPARRRDLVQGQMIRLPLSNKDMKLKYDKPRAIDVPYDLMEDLWWYAGRHRKSRQRAAGAGATSTSLFLTQNGTPYGDTALTDIFVALEKRVGFRVRPHMLRHTYGTYTLWKLRKVGFDGEPLLYVRDRMGHSSVSTTAIYLHLINQLGAQLVLLWEDEIDALFGIEG